MGVVNPLFGVSSHVLMCALRLLGDLKNRRLNLEEFSSPFGFKTKIGSELANIFCILFDRLDE